jgi:hypothetical protein
VGCVCVQQACFFWLACILFYCSCYLICFQVGRLSEWCTCNFLSKYKLTFAG